MTSVNDPTLTIVMAVHNEAKYIHSLKDILKTDQGNIFEILIINDRSTDDTFEQCQLLADKYEKIKLFQNDSGYTLNQMIMFLLNNVQTNFVHIRTPHDFYSPNFYEFHLKRLTEYPKAVLSSNYTKNRYELTEYKFNRLNLNLLFSRIYNRLVDHNLSSCGFIVKSEIIKPIWKKYICFEKHADWFAKKEICLFYETLHSFNTLSYYNLNKSQSNSSAKEDKSLQRAILTKARDNFWAVNKRRYISYPEHEIPILDAFYFLIPEKNKTIWFAVFLVTCFRSIIKKFARRFRDL